jgi:hypothetical protein
VNTFVLEIWDDQPAKVTFHTVRWESAELSETDKFVTRYANNSTYKEDLQKLIQLITNVIGNTYGAKIAYFNRQENKATALPPKGAVEEVRIGIDFPFRLFCYRINENIVILFNGGLKTSEKVQNSPDLSMKFREAQSFVKAIEDGFRNDFIEIDHKKRCIISTDNDTDQTIYLH